MTRRPVLLFPATLLALCLCLAFASGVRASDLKKDFKAAWNEFHSLASNKKKSQYRVHWQNLEKKFLDIHKADPQGEFAPKSLYYAGRVNLELGARSFLASDSRRAVDYFQRVADGFPDHTWCDDALFYAARVQLDQLKDSEAARATLNRILAEYPKGDILADAKALLESLPAPEQAVAEAPPETPSEAPAESPAKPVDGSQTRTAPGQEPAPVPFTGPNHLSGVRHQTSDTYTRVAINVDHRVPYRYEALPADSKRNKPPRLYVDFESTTMAKGLKTTIDIADGIIRQARIAQHSSDVVRVVLDFEDSQEFQIFTLDNPFRLLIDVSAPKGGPRKPAPPVEPEPEPEPKPETKPEPKAELNPEPKPEPEIKPVQAEEKAPEPEAVAVIPPEPEPEPRPIIHPPKPGPKNLAALERAREPGDPPLPAQSKKQTGDLFEQLGFTVQTIMIDPGHGGRDHGAAHNGITEKKLNLKFAKILGDKLKAQGFTVLYTRTTDKYLSLTQRTEMANDKNADLFISLHCNANADSKRVRGLETYYLNPAKTQDVKHVAARENDVGIDELSDLEVIISELQIAVKVQESRNLAKAIHKNLYNRIAQNYEVRDRKARPGPFSVLLGAQMPAVLVELGYITNADEAKRLKSETFLKRAAEGLAKGIVAYKNQLKKAASL